MEEGCWCEVRSCRHRSNYADSCGSSFVAPIPARNENAQMSNLRKSGARAAKTCSGQCNLYGSTTAVDESHCVISEGSEPRLGDTE